MITVTQYTEHSIWEQPLPVVLLEPTVVITAESILTKSLEGGIDIVLLDTVNGQIVTVFMSVQLPSLTDKGFHTLLIGQIAQLFQIQVMGMERKAAHSIVRMTVCPRMGGRRIVHG